MRRSKLPDREKHRRSGSSLTGPWRPGRVIVEAAGARQRRRRRQNNPGWPGRRPPCTTCKLWCRIIVDAGFLTRFRALHAPCVAGHYHAFDPEWVEYGSPPITGNPVFLPSSSPSNIVHSRHFALDFLPESDSGWAIADSHGGLLLLFQRRTIRSPDLLVCDPLTRRYQGILGDVGTLGSFLLDGDDHRHARTSVSNFRVIEVGVGYLESEHDEGRYGPAVCVFSPGNDAGGWQDLPTNSDGITLPRSTKSIAFAGRVNGALYWVTGEDGFLLVLDEAAISFSQITFPADSAVATGCCDKWSFRVTGGEDGALRVVRTISSNLTIFKRKQGSDSNHEWVVERFLRLRDAPVDLPGRDVDYWYFYRNAMIVAAHETYVLITPQEKTCLFSVELDTMQVEQDKERHRYPGPAYPCELPWPPAMEACAAALDHRRRRRGRTFFY